MLEKFGFKFKIVELVRGQDGVIFGSLRMKSLRASELQQISRILENFEIGWRSISKSTKLPETSKLAVFQARNLFKMHLETALVLSMLIESAE